MSEIHVSRTLVKSPPEVWAAMSDTESLARHLDAFGEIRITRLEPETTVAWEGERASGTVQLTASGWGTRVTLTAAVEPSAETPEVEPTPPETPDLQPVPDLDPGPDSEPPPELQPLPDLEPVPDLDPLPDPPEPEVPPAAASGTRRGFWASFFGRRREVAPLVARAAHAVEPRLVAAEPPAPPVRPLPPPVERAAVVVPEPDPVAPMPVPASPEPIATWSDPEPAAPSVDAEAILAGVLDDLGAAHHRPFSRG